MNKNLIKTVLFFIALQTQLLASTYEWSVKSNKTQAYVHEAIHLEYVCTFSDRAELYAIDFDPVVQNENYTLKLLSKTTKIVDAKKQNSYEYVVFAHKPAELHFAFEAQMKKTNKDSIENTVIGRDNGEYAEYATKTLKLQELVVNVLEHNASVAGTVTLEVTKDALDIKAYEPFHMEVKFSGNANLQNLAPLEFEIENVEVFSQEPKIETELTKEGYKGAWSQKFAFVATKDFTIPAINRAYFDLQNASLKDLTQEKIEVKVTTAFNKEELLDEEPKSFTLKKEYLYYVLTFLAGFLVAKIKTKRAEKNSKERDDFMQKVQNATSLKALCMVLVLEDTKKYEPLILKIEQGELTSLKEAKKLISY
jgi:hypothetical protein